MYTSHKEYNSGPITRPYYAATETAGTNNRVWKQLMREWYGLTPVRGLAWYDWARCPHRLLKTHGCGREKKRTLCDWGFEWPVWDHTRAWRDGDGELVLTSEPWGSPLQMSEELSEMSQELYGREISIAFEGCSPYGASFILFFVANHTDLGKRFEWHRTRGF